MISSKRRFLSAFVVVGVTVAATEAFAVRPSALETGGLEVAPGVPAVSRVVPMGFRQASPRRAEAWRRFEGEVGAGWRALWDETTDVPARLWGRGVAAPGSVADGAVAVAHARAFLERHIELLSPGSSVDDFELAADDLDAGGVGGVAMRTVAFAQRVLVGGTAPGARLAVVGASVSFRYKNDRLFVVASSALPAARGRAWSVAGGDAEAAALSWIGGRHGEVAVGRGAQPVVLPLRRPGRAVGVTAFHVVVEAAAPRGRYDVFVDADGRVLAREQLLRFAGADVVFDAPVRAPQDARADYAARLLDVTVDGAAATTDDAGLLSWNTGLPAAVDLGVVGQRVDVANQSGDAATASFTVDDGGQARWSLADDEVGDAQLSAYIHTALAKDRALVIDPASDFATQTQLVRVNGDDPQFMCNAYWDGTATNFFRASGSCNNTARLADVVYHEYGHGVHQHAIIPSAGGYDASMGEGAADYLAATITGDPVLAPGFFDGGGYLRELDEDRRWPDDISNDPHETGLIFAGTMWDLRTLLAADLGEGPGVALADSLWYASLRRSTDIPSSYAEVLAADDDDGDLENGTPHVCAINAAFVRHGLAGFVNSAGLVATHEALSVVAPDEPAPVRVTTTELFPQCTGDPIESVSVVVRPRGSSGSPETVELEQDGADWVGELSARHQGTGIEYAVFVGTKDAVSRLPANPADDSYRAFVGKTRELACTDFEDGSDGWVFGDGKGGSGDFEWGEPAGKGGDPEHAFSGTHVIGDRLGGEGTYGNKKLPFADGPVVDLAGEKHVRLQFRRWLTVEDGYFDQASLYVNGTRFWQNQGTDETNGVLTHRDTEWRFEDIDLSVLAAAGTAQVRFEIVSDVAARFGGWTVDDVCFVAWDPPPPAELPDAGADAAPPPAATDDVYAGGGCGCRTHGDAPPRSGAVALVALAVALAGRRRRRA